MQPILQHIFQKDSLQEVPLEALQQLAEQYPFFGPGQFLLAKKLYATDREAFGKQVKKTALYFSNPLWLHHLLTSNADRDAALPTPGQTEKLLQDDPDSQPVQSSGSHPEPLLKVMLQHEPVTDQLELPAYHTIDYFASQGIQLRLEEEADKLGKQLKSFTEWLKTMRRLPQAAAPQGEKINEEAIYQQASSSLEEREIVTETMAEVLVKQQNTQKAIQIYNKLGLQYPSKKAYFAAKIQALNNSV